MTKHKDWYLYQVPTDHQQDVSMFRNDDCCKWEFVYLKKISENLVSACTCQGSSEGILAFLRSPTQHHRLSSYNYDEIAAVTGENQCVHQEQVRSVLSGVFDVKMQWTKEQTDKILPVLSTIELKEGDVDFSQWNEPNICIELSGIPDPKPSICKRYVVIPLSNNPPSVVTEAYNKKYKSTSIHCHRCPKKARACCHKTHVKLLSEEEPTRTTTKQPSSKTGLGIHSIDPNTHKLKPTCLSTNKIPEPAKMSKETKRRMADVMSRIIRANSLRTKPSSVIQLPLADEGKHLQQHANPSSSHTKMRFIHFECTQVCLRTETPWKNRTQFLFQKLFGL